MEIVSYAMGEGAGYDEGYKAGEESSTAYQEGYDAGETAGYNSGYSAGYDEGVASVNSVKALIDARDAENLFNANSNNLSNLITNTQLANILKYNDTENATSTLGMFSEQKNLTSIPEINTANVTMMNLMFGCNAGNSYPCFFNGGSPPMMNTSNVTNVYYMFGSRGQPSKVESMPLYDFKKVTNAAGLFHRCNKLKSIPAFNFQGLPTSYKDFYTNSQITGCMTDCTSLEEIHIKDIHYDFDISVSTKFTREALVEIIGNLRDMTGDSALTLKMGATNMAKLTTDDIAVATAKNWTIA